LHTAQVFSVELLKLLVEGATDSNTHAHEQVLKSGQVISVGFTALKYLQLEIVYAVVFFT
jgi:hypothetical protein